MIIIIIKILTRKPNRKKLRLGKKRPKKRTSVLLVARYVIGRKNVLTTIKKWKICFIHF